MSRVLTEHSIDHVVLERGEVANSWRRERWDSLRLLTPNWLSRLPGYAYAGSDPDGFMNLPQVVDFIAGYAADIRHRYEPIRPSLREFHRGWLPGSD
jgi:putative flavoprotein involved in K+ transport